MGDKLIKMTLDRLIERTRVLEEAIKTHRTQKADDRCVEDDDRLYEALGDGIKCDRRVGSKEEMLKNCARFIDRRCAQGHWPTYADLEARNQILQRTIDLAKGKPEDLIEAFMKACQLSPASTEPSEMMRRFKEAREALEVALLPSHLDTECRRLLAQSQEARLALQAERDSLETEVADLRSQVRRLGADW